MADEPKPGSGNPLLDAFEAALKPLTKESLEALKDTHAIDGASFPATLMAYRQLRRAADAIARRVVEHKVSRILVQAGDDVGDLSEFRTFIPRLDLLNQSLTADVSDAREVLSQSRVLGAKEFVAAAGVIGAAISAVLSIGAALFRSDIKDQYASVTLEDDTCGLLVANLLQGDGSEVKFPNTFNLEFSDSAEKPVPGRLISKLLALQDTASDLLTVLGQIEQRLGPQPDKAADPPNRVAEKLAGMKERLQGSVQALKTFDDGFGAVAHRMFRADEKDAFLKNDGYILTVHVLAGGGGTRTVSKYLKSRVFHSGGVVVRYALFDSRGTVVETNILSRHASAEETEEQLEKWQTEV